MLYQSGLPFMARELVLFSWMMSSALELRHDWLTVQLIHLLFTTVSTLKMLASNADLVKFTSITCTVLIEHNRRLLSEVSDHIWKWEGGQNNCCVYKHTTARRCGGMLPQNIFWNQMLWDCFWSTLVQKLPLENFIQCTCSPGQDSGCNKCGLGMLSWEWDYKQVGSK